MDGVGGDYKRLCWGLNHIAAMSARYGAAIFRQRTQPPRRRSLLSDGTPDRRNLRRGGVQEGTRLDAGDVVAV